MNRFLLRSSPVWLFLILMLRQSVAAEPSLHEQIDALIDAKITGKVVSKQAHLLGRLSVLGFDSKEKTALETGVLDVLKNSEIEGEKLVESQVRSSIAKNLGLNYDEDELLTHDFLSRC